jgi:hypothetical protein
MPVWEVEADQAPDCSICLSPSPGGYANNLFYTLACGHGSAASYPLHVHCLSQMQAMTCPICRADISAEWDDIIGESLR